jgi:hypothetical protein
VPAVVGNELLVANSAEVRETLAIVVPELLRLVSVTLRPGGPVRCRGRVLARKRGPLVLGHVGCGERSADVRRATVTRLLVLLEMHVCGQVGNATAAYDWSSGLATALINTVP